MFNWIMKKLGYTPTTELLEIQDHSYALTRRALADARALATIQTTAYAYVALYDSRHSPSTRKAAREDMMDAIEAAVVMK